MNTIQERNEHEKDVNLYDKIENKEFADLYLQSVHTTTKRCYWAYSALLLVCITAIMAFYLEYFSYTEKYVKSANIELTDVVRKEYINKFVKCGIYTKTDSIYYAQGNDVTKALLDNQIRNFVDTQYISFPILGFKLSTSDTLFLISIFFILVSLWSFYCVRGENFTIGKVLNETSNFPLSCRKYIFQGICFNNLFFPTTLRTTPYSKLKTPLSLNEKISDKHNKRLRSNRFLVKLYSWAPKIIFYLPCFIIFCNLGLHIYDLSKLNKSTSTYELINLDGNKSENRIQLPESGDVFHLNDEKVFRMNYIHQISSLKKYGTSHIIFGTIITFISLIVVCFIVMEIIDYITGTNRILYQYRRKMKHDEEIAWISNKVNEQYNIKDVYIVPYCEIHKEDTLHNNSHLYYGTSVSDDSLEKVITELERLVGNFYKLNSPLKKKLLNQMRKIKEEGGSCKKMNNKKKYEYFLFIEFDEKKSKHI